MANEPEDPTSASPTDVTFGVLIERYLSGVATTDEVAALNQRLIVSPEHRDLFVRMANLSGLIVEHFAQFRAHADIESAVKQVSPSRLLPSVVAPEQESVADTSRNTRGDAVLSRKAISPIHNVLRHSTVGVLRPIFWSILGAGVLFAAYFTAVSWDMFGKHLAKESEDNDPKSKISDPRYVPKSEIESVATIRDSDEVEWSDEKSRIRNPKSQVTANQPLSIQSGLVELQLNSGTTLRIEGPAEWSIVDANRVQLRVGKLLARVPKQASGFTVETPTSQIVDLGTEFGVQVTQDGTTETQVFEGLVDVEWAQSESSRLAQAATKQKQTLTAGQALRIDSTGGITSIAPLTAKRELFIKPMATEIPAKPLASAGELSPYAKYVIERTRPIAYWDFSRYQHSVKVGQDRVSGIAFEQFLPTRAGVPGPTAQQGFAGFGEWNPALSQQSDGAQLLGLVFRQTEVLSAGYSIAAWIQPLRPFNQQLVYYVLGNGRLADQPLDGVQDSVMIVGTLVLAQRGKLGYFDGKDHQAPRFPTGKTALVPGKWYWLVLVRTPGKVSLYLNGALEIESESQWANAPGELFSFGHRVDLEPTLPFQGQLDEATLWDRPLTANEIETTFRQSKLNIAERGASP